MRASRHRGAARAQALGLAWPLIAALLGDGAMHRDALEGARSAEGGVLRATLNKCLISFHS